MLCDRTVVINHGSRIFDGKTEELFAKYQKYRQVTVSFAQALEAPLLPEGAVFTEETPCKYVIRVPKEQVGVLMEGLISRHPVDLTVEEEEIGTVVERIYQGVEEAPGSGKEGRNEEI